jgi:hypothetical protein
VPKHKDLKRLVRARMAETSENYTQALTSLLGETALDPLPDGWFTAGTHPAQYGAGLLPRDCAYDGKRVIQLRFHAAEPPGGFGTVMQSIDAARYRGRRVRYSAMIRGREITSWAGAWLRVDTAAGARALDNMQDRALRGTTAWTEAANVLDVPMTRPRCTSACCCPGPGRWTSRSRASKSSAPTYRSPGPRAGHWPSGHRASTSASPDRAPVRLGGRPASQADDDPMTALLEAERLSLRAFIPDDAQRPSQRQEAAFGFVLLYLGNPVWELMTADKSGLGFLAGITSEWEVPESSL